MSINQFYPELPEAQWWSRYRMDHSPPAKTSSSHHKPLLTTTAAASHSSSAATMLFNRSSAAAFDLNDDDDEHASSTAELPKERLFEKPLTPSDVGKLNRLVIPKQHAEKHFPISGGADSGESGLLLGFEDELGKSWRFRYSYWNSSQSYVLTKGWSRFVKEKRLESGDIIVFSRHSIEASRHFIGWRRRSSNGNSTPPTPPLANGGAAAWSRMVYSGHRYPIQQLPPPNSLHFRSESVHAGTEACLQQRQTGGGNSKTLRLFGVNLECQADDESEPSTPVGSPMSTHPHHYYTNNHMDINFSAADLYRQR